MITIGLSMPLKAWIVVTLMPGRSILWFGAQSTSG